MRLLSTAGCFFLDRCQSVWCRDKPYIINQGSGMFLSVFGYIWVEAVYVGFEKISIVFVDIRQVLFY